jgi:tRNA modification GTPase
MINENISAISTPAGCGGVAIIRISGNGALNVAQKMFVPTAKISVKDFVPNFMYTGKIKGDGFEDFGMCVYFKAPKSFTGEDVVELHCHGGTQIARGILKATFLNGCRAAERGEFTKRAFLNGKLSLSSAEGMIDMINAESLAEIRAGSMLYAESLTKKLSPVQRSLTDILAGIAADIDYPEEDVASTSLSGVKDELLGLKSQIESLSKSYEGGRKIKQGVTVVLCGRPNVGKSSILNALLGYDKAIVSSIAGTTRDAVEGVIELNGVKCNLVDTAGLREQADEIEAIGIQKAKSILSSADVVLYVTEGNDDSSPEVDLTDSRVIKIANKCDIYAAQSQNYDVVISAKTGEGIDKLRAVIAQKALGDTSLDKAYIIEERHFAALKRAEQALQNAIDGVGVYPLDLIALDINEAWVCLGEITGETANESIINTVFEKFCVGK